MHRNHSGHEALASPLSGGRGHRVCAHCNRVDVYTHSTVTLIELFLELLLMLFVSAGKS